MVLDLASLLGHPVPPADRTIFWSGAGISAEAPTSGPLGVTLTEEALDRLFVPGTRDEVGWVFSVFGRSGPRLETVLGVCLQDEAHGLGGLKLLDRLAVGEPNRLHRFFGRHLETGGRHVTANFDLCIERTLTDARRRDAVLHVHGRLDDPESVRSGGSVALLQRGLQDSVASRLASWLATAELIVFVGYSGSDYFDIDPFLESWIRSGAARARRFLWVHHERRPLKPQRQVEALRAASVPVTEVVVPTVDVLAALSSAWGIVAPEPAEPWADYRRRDDLLGTERSRIAATVLLWDHVGSSERALGLLSVAGFPPERTAGLAAEAAWGSGRYANARRHYRVAMSGGGLSRRIARWERIGATHGVQGRWILGATVLALTLRLALAKSIDPGPLPETLVRLLRHMENSPDTARLRPGRLLPWAENHLPAPDPATHGVHLANRFGDLRGRLPADQEERVKKALESFTEFDSLHAVLNFTHGTIRRAAEDGCVDADMVRRQVAQAVALGRPESLYTLVLLPGLDALFPLRQRLSSALSLQLTPYHRLRRLAAGPLPWPLARTRRWHC